MAFGKNPHVAKAQAAEQKAEVAADPASETRAWLEAAHLWERAADKEQPGKRQTEYLNSAQAARDRSDSPKVREGTPLERVAARLQLVTPLKE